MTKLKLKPGRVGSREFARQLSRGLEHHRAGRLDAAEHSYKRALALRPGDTDALHYLGVLAHQRGDHDKAVELIRQAVKAQLPSAQMYCNLGDAERAAGRPIEAEAACRYALKLRPSYPEARLNLGAALFQQRRFPEAESEARAALMLQPDFATASLLLADSLREQRKIVEAESAYRTILAMVPNNWAALANFGWMLVEIGQFEEALELCRRAAAQESENLLPRACLYGAYCSPFADQYCPKRNGDVDKADSYSSLFAIRELCNGPS